VVIDGARDGKSFLDSLLQSSEISTILSESDLREIFDGGTSILRRAKLSTMYLPSRIQAQHDDAKYPEGQHKDISKSTRTSNQVVGSSILSGRQKVSGSLGASELSVKDSGR